MTGRPTNDGADYLLSLLVGEPVVPIYYMALISGDAPSYSISGSELDEPSPADYGRAAYTSESGNWAVQTGVLTNAQEIDFPIATTDWGTIRYWAMCDDPLSGRALFVGEFPSPLPVPPGEQVYIPPGGLSIAVPTTVWRLYL